MLDLRRSASSPPRFMGCHGYVVTFLVKETPDTAFWVSLGVSLSLFDVNRCELFTLSRGLLSSTGPFKTAVWYCILCVWKSLQIPH